MPPFPITVTVLADERRLVNSDKLSESRIPTTSGFEAINVGEQPVQMHNLSKWNVL